jgi:hypothetical protein
MFEKKQEALATTLTFVKRMFHFLLISTLVMSAALGIGVLGYHHIAHLDWIDALLNAAMILSGMGPVDTLTDDAAKLFASLYALFSGIIFISTMGIILTPLFHRVIHKFHADEGERDD